MTRKSIILLILGLLLLIIPFCFANYSPLRLIILAIAIFLITLSLIFLKKKNIFLIILTPITLICLSYAVDTFMFYKFNRIPLFVVEIKSSDSISTYNSFFYRIFNCNNSLILDYGYKKNYACNSEDLNVIDVNTFLSEINENYEENKGKFVKISGKISKLSGVESIELSSYTSVKDSLNGYVNFNNNFVIRAHVNEDLSSYRIYDNITVIGRITSKDNEDGVTIINLEDVKLIPSDIYESYTYEIINNSDTTLTNLVSEQNFYLYGISDFNVLYDNNTTYELSYLITDLRITLDNLIGNVSGTNMYDETNTLVAKAYDLPDFNALVCENGKKILANKNFELGINLCNE